MPNREATYYDLKHYPGSPYRYVKELLRGHLNQTPSILPHFEKCGELHSTGCSSNDGTTPIPPFRGWIVSGEKWESFTVDGRVRMDPEVFIIPKIETEPPLKTECDAEIGAQTPATPALFNIDTGVSSPDTVLVTPPPPPKRYSDIVMQGRLLNLGDPGSVQVS